MEVLTPQSIAYPVDAQPLSVAAYSPKPKFDALTSLRFFAAALVVVAHSTWRFFDGSGAGDWPAGQGVAFFFILSGFVLTCVYPKLQGTQQVKQFLIARFGRIWPTHLVTACFYLWLFSVLSYPVIHTSATMILANLFLVQSWIPDNQFIRSLNAPSWSISCEFFFYVCFIWLVRTWKFDLLKKTALALGIFLIACIVSAIFATSKHHLKLDYEYILYFNPITRLSDFIVGIITAKFFLRFGHRIHLNKWLATAIEIILITMIVMEMRFVYPQLHQSALKLWPCLSYWLERNGPTPIFALLIFIAALEQGYLTKALANTVFIWLGEISYSMYLLHGIPILYFDYYVPELARLNCGLSYFLYWALVILLSHINYGLIEDPFRNLAKHLAAKPFAEYHFSNLFKLFGTHFRSILLAILIMTTLLIASQIYNQTAESRFEFTELNVRNIYFGKEFVLEKAYWASAKDGAKIKLIWKTVLRKPIKHTFAIIQILDKHEQLLTEFNKTDFVTREQIWTETIYLPVTKKQRQNWTNIGLRLCIHQDRRNFLSIHNGHRDFWNTRLIIPIVKEALLDTDNSQSKNRT